MKRWGALAIGLAVATSVLYLVRGSRLDADAARSARENALPMAGAQPGEDLPTKSEAERAGLAPTAPSDASRTAVKPAQRTGTVLLSDRTGATGAAVSWTPIEAFLPWSTWDWDEIDRDWWRAASRETEASAQGHFDFGGEVVGDPEWGSVLWASRVGQEAAFRVLLPSAQSLEGEIVLADAAPLVVRVADALGQPVAGALVEQHGALLEGVSAHEVPRHVALLFYRTAITDERGEARLCAFPGTQAVRATLGEGVSRPRLCARGETSAVLLLEQSFVALGTINKPVSAELTGEITPRITFAVLIGNLWHELGTLAVRGSESFGPLLLPCTQGDAYRARVHGVGLIPKDTPFAAPKPGDRVRLDLTAEVGLEQWYLVTDQAENPLPDAKVEATWLAEDGKTEQSVLGYARPDGYVSVLGVKPGRVAARASAPGYATASSGAIELPTPERGFIHIALSPGAALRGRVTLAGQPVRDFQVTLWRSEQVMENKSYAFTNREDGTFAIDGAPLGSVGLVAASPESPGSVPLQIDVPEEGAEIELELQPAIFGQGRVVDRATGAAVPGARVQPFVMSGSGSACPWGAPIAVQPDGRFRARAFHEGSNTIHVDAPGFGTRVASAAAVRGEVDFGLVELTPPVDLEVVILGASEEQAAIGYDLRATGPLPIAFSRFERAADGELHGVLRGLPEGSYRFHLQHPDWSDQDLYFDVREGAGPLRFRTGGGGSLQVQVVGEPDAQASLLLEYLDETGTDTRRVQWLPSSGEISFAGLSAGPLSVSLFEGADVVARAETHIENGRTATVVLTRGGGSILLRVVDGEGEPVSGVFTRMWLQGASLAPVFSGMTDSAGEKRFGGLSGGDYLVHLVHSARGTLANVTLSVSGGEDVERELVLDAKASIELQALDGDVPLAGLACSLVDAFGKAILPPVLTSDDGRAVLSNLTSGTYLVDLAGEGVWPLRASVAASESGGLQTLQMRRLGDLSVLVHNQDALPVADVEVALVFEPTSESVAGWIAAGKLAADKLVTDKNGKLVLSGVPHGKYRWSASAFQGEIAVKPLEVTKLSIAID